MEVSQTNLLICRYSFLSWIFISKLCWHKVNEIVLFKAGKTLFLLDFVYVIWHTDFSLFLNGTEFSISNKYAQSSCQNKSEHLCTRSKIAKAQPVCPLDLPTLTRAPHPKDRAATRQSMWQLKVGCGVHTNLLYAAKVQLLSWKKTNITNYHFVFPENELFLMELHPCHSRTSQFC